MIGRRRTLPRWVRIKRAAEAAALARAAQRRAVRRRLVVLSALGLLLAALAIGNCSRLIPLTPATAARVRIGGAR